MKKLLLLLTLVVGLQAEVTKANMNESLNSCGHGGKYKMMCLGLGEVYKNGAVGKDITIKPNPVLAEKYYMVACNNGVQEGCNEAERIHSITTQADQDIFNQSKSVDNLSTDCLQNGFGSSCHVLGQQFKANGDNGQALSMFKKSCEFNNGDGCFTAATEVLKKGDDPAHDPVFLKKLDKACSLRSGVACRFAGKIKEAKGDYLAAYKDYVAGSELGDQEAGLHTQLLPQKLIMMGKINIIKAEIVKQSGL